MRSRGKLKRCGRNGLLGSFGREDAQRGVRLRAQGRRQVPVALAEAERSRGKSEMARVANSQIVK